MHRETRQTEVVQLADPDFEAAMLSELRRERRRLPARTSELKEAERFPTFSRKRHCRCGKCALCMDNARWERIFREKFQDLGYYGRGPVIRGSSPLHQL